MKINDLVLQSLSITFLLHGIKNEFGKLAEEIRTGIFLHFINCFFSFFKELIIQENLKQRVKLWGINIFFKWSKTQKAGHWPSVLKVKNMKIDSRLFFFPHSKKFRLHLRYWEIRSPTIAFRIPYVFRGHRFFTVTSKLVLNKLIHWKVVFPSLTSRQE